MPIKVLTPAECRQQLIEETLRANGITEKDSQASMILKLTGNHNIETHLKGS